MFDLVCTTHGETISVPCGRWRECSGCAARLGWKLYLRFLAGIEQFDHPYIPNFFTLTFPEHRAPDEDEAHASLRALVRRLRYRDLLDTFGWVLQRQSNSAATLHYHGIAHMRWMDDDLEEWRKVVTASGFGIQNKLEQAKPKHAHYCSRYISRSLASVTRLRRAYSFSPSFPKPAWEKEDQSSDAIDALLASFGIEDDDQTDHSWEPARGLLT
jgi:hypothetical protein